MKKLLTIMIATILCFLFLNIEKEASATKKQSPTSGYTMFLNESPLPLYSTINGKKKVVTIKDKYTKEGVALWQIVTMKKMYPNGWSKVSYKSNNRTYTGYTKSTNLKPNVTSFDYAVVKNKKGVSLRKSHNVKSKQLATIPLGTFLELTYEENSVIMINKKVEWIRVYYYQNGKKIKGFVSYKDVL